MFLSVIHKIYFWNWGGVGGWGCGHVANRCPLFETLGVGNASHRAPDVCHRNGQDRLSKCVNAHQLEISFCFFFFFLFLNSFRRYSLNLLRKKKSKTAKKKKNLSENSFVTVCLARLGFCSVPGLKPFTDLAKFAGSTNLTSLTLLCSTSRHRLLLSSDRDLHGWTLRLLLCCSLFVE